MNKYIKLSDYAKNFSISYKTAYRYWKDKKLKGFQDSKTGTIFQKLPKMRGKLEKNGLILPIILYYYKIWRV